MIEVSEAADTPALRLERELIAGIFNAMNHLQERHGLDPIETVSTFLANLAADQAAPHITLQRIHRVAEAKLRYLLKKMRRQCD